MPLLNSQYDALMRQYDEKRDAHRHELRDREEEIDRVIPEYRRLTNRISALSVQAARIRVFDPDADISTYMQELLHIRAAKSALLLQHGYPADYLEMQYDCRECHDTGLIDGKKCSCFKKAAIDLLYKEYRLGNILEKENFSHFSFGWYSDTIQVGARGLTEKQLARNAYNAALHFSKKIGQPDNNLYIYGNAGVGKTFLTHCIAKEVIEDTHSALYFSAREFFEILADATFERGGRNSSYERMILEADFLTIDDLGTEVTSTFVSSQFFYVLNERIRHNRSTVISTNIAPHELVDLYSERILSRIINHYSIIRLACNDIRIQKKKTGGNT
ncbi:MAG: ATP-binding protein [Lachnospiraceae bacterium]|nr:ATP-binding protein [Lachnospiraceae bacterium]